MTESCPFCGAECHEKEVDIFGSIQNLHFCDKCNAVKLPDNLDFEVGGRIVDGWLQIPRVSIELED